MIIGVKRHQAGNAGDAAGDQLVRMQKQLHADRGGDAADHRFEDGMLAVSAGSPKCFSHDLTASLIGSCITFPP